MKATGQQIAAVTALLALTAMAGTPAGDNKAYADTAPAGIMRIPQPPLEKLSGRTRNRIAPESQRVDLLVPVFSNSTRVTNSLFPISDLHSAVLVGKFEGKAWRAETTLLRETRAVEWNGQNIETLQSQFVAYLNGRIYEVAVDLYAQADDGSVWYFGEAAYSYEKGRINDVNETWHAGVEGPATMIMPGHPRAGDVYRPENIPGLIFEQVTVTKINEKQEGPTGIVGGVMIGRELHMEGDLEDKSFAPGYGELRSGLGDDYEATALVVPADALSQPLPAELPRLSNSALGVLDAARSKDWEKASAGIDELRGIYSSFRGRNPPKKLDAQMSETLDLLAKGIKAHDAVAAAPAAFALALGVADLTLRYLPPAEVDRMRFELWARELAVDAAAEDSSAVAGDVATLEWLRDRLVFSAAEVNRIEDQLRYLRAAADALDMTAAANAADRLRATAAGMKPK